MWYNNIKNPQAILSVYSVPPDLSQVGISSIIIDYDTWKITLYLELPAFPDKPPKKWHEDCDFARVSIDCYEIEDLKMSGTPSLNAVIFSINKLNEMQSVVSLKGESFEFSFKASIISIVGIEGHERID